ncbi:MAG: hypothetical protein JXR94_12820 [Candidatus Hydrogenedentes bacterium]|nr:hypothetical protein [Candidatus Hydrogenedentota bacterium]
MKRGETVYFEKGGPQNTEAALDAVRARVPELKPDAVVVATTSGRSALVAARALADTGVRVIAVPFQKHLYDKYGPPDPELAAQCRESGVEFLPEEPTVPMLDTHRPDIVNAWRTMSQGFKVALQVASMCVDLGMLDAGAHVIALGGSGEGADTAVAVHTYGYDDVLKSNVTGIIAMPVA